MTQFGLMGGFTEATRDRDGAKDRNVSIRLQSPLHSSIRTRLNMSAENNLSLFQ